MGATIKFQNLVHSFVVFLARYFVHVISNLLEEGVINPDLLVRGS